MNSGDGLDPRTALVILVAGIVTYIALLHPAVGVALLVGVGVAGLVHLLLK